MNNFHVIIPARYESSRLPAKPLAKINDKEMILHVCERAKESGAKSITVATDHLDIKRVVDNAGFTAIMTRIDHESGSDRIYEAAELLNLEDDDIIVNVQGDEPFIPVANIQQVANIISNTSANMATLCCGIDSDEEANNPNAVKVIFDLNRKAIYFSRSIIPFVRTESLTSKFNPDNHFRHIGIYAYTKKFLKQFVNWPISKLELLEKLEQLRVIENGAAIYLDVLDLAPPAGIDTPEDLVRANQSFE
ncbi:MAG: 3-deoxy-manno-octulosonate cytidylyltransferase [Gammaproteobacteria bacterium]|nr:MAG: 3-deoxy-manno-octulosonate cytidylyltransferase [Gammaproteobacteria bacterium]